MRALILALMVLLMPIAAHAQTFGDSNFPAPAAGEFGPGTYIDDSLVLKDHVTTGAPSHTTGEMAPDVVGAFRFDCAPGQVLADDPVVYPGKPGRSHGHQFYGNTSVNANSTYASERAALVTTCQNSLNNTGYWMPAVLTHVTGKWMVQRPEYVRIYYKREPKGSAACTKGSSGYIGECVGIPDTLHMIFGYDMISGTLTNGQKLFKCVAPNGSNRSGFWDHLPYAAQFCQNGDHMDFYIDSSPCWDGVNLDSPNHRSHVHDLVNGACPATHPKYMPHFTLQADFLVDDGLNKSGTWSQGQITWYLSSDVMFGMPPMEPGSTFHADYSEAWNHYVKKAWTDNCIDRMLNCSTGDLGNGYLLKPEWPLYYSAANPGSRLVPLPAGMMGPFLGNKLHGSQ